MKNKKTLKVPENNGEFFCSHDLAEIPSILKSNQKLKDSYKLKIAGKNYSDYRRKVEIEILGLATDKNAGLYQRPYIATGHQPVLCHPGIWIKNIFMDKIARENNGSAFDFVIDYDCISEIGSYVLTQREKIEKTKEVLLNLDRQQPIECYSAPDHVRFEEFCQKIQRHLQSFSNSRIPQYLENFYQKGKGALDNSKNLTEFLVKTRKEYEEDRFHYFDIILSRFCMSSSFLLFVLHIAEDIKHFFTIYNKKLDEYRISHKLRYKANPFPDLNKDMDKFEIPFWIIEDNKRKPVYTSFEGPFVSFYSENNLIFKYKKGDFDEAAGIIKGKGIKFRPKAISLTLFLRLFFTDLFIHGISGAKYDEVTDGIIEEYFKVQPPGYIAVSLTLFPDLPLKGVQKIDIDKLKIIIRNIEFKPEMYEDKIADQELKKKFRELIDEKQKLLQYVPSGKDKKEYYQHIKAITETLSSFLDKYYLECTKQLKVLEKQEQENNIICYREYPYFLYDVDRVKNTIK